jgi:hypothetical protein
MGIIEYLTEEKYQQGKVEGEEKKNRLFVENLLRDTDHAMAKIASLADVSLYYVKKVKSALHKKAAPRKKK